MQIGLFYGSTTCYTEMAAEKIQEIIGKDTITLFNIKDEPLKQAEQFDFLIFGISTWGLRRTSGRLGVLTGTISTALI